MARKSVREMQGEFLREAAVLVLVFGFLDGVLRGIRSAWFYVAVFAMTAVFLTFGMLAETRRREE